MLIEVNVTEDNDLNERESADAPIDVESNSNPWFGYIGLGIAMVSMVIGLAGIVAAVFFFFRWTQG